MDNLLKGIPGVMTYLEYTLITGPTEQEHLLALEGFAPTCQGWSQSQEQILLYGTIRVLPGTPN